MAEYNEEGLVSLIMETKKGDAAVVKWNIHESYSSIDRDYGNWQSDKTAYSMILDDRTLVVKEDEDAEGDSVIRLSYADSSGSILLRDEGESKAVMNALDSLATESHDVSICGKRSLETWVLEQDSSVKMTVTDDNVRYYIDCKELLHEAKTPYTEEFYSGLHAVSTCLNGQFADMCCEHPFGMLAVASGKSSPFTDGDDFKKAVREAVQ